MMIEQPQDRIDAAIHELRQAALELQSVPKKLIGGLSQNLRRLRTFENESQWSKALLDSCAPFASRVAVFSINVQSLRLQAARGIDSRLDQDVPLASARAFAAAVDSAEPAVALRTAGEMSPQLAAFFGESPAERFSVFPIVAGTRVAGIVYAERADGPAIDLVATVAGAVLEGRSGTGGLTPATATGIIGIASAAATGSRGDSNSIELLHLRARRFARRFVAEMVLEQSGDLEAGRARGNIYAALKRKIDQGRDDYQKQFLESPSVGVDYLHQELVQTLGRKNEALLGPGYPGSLS